MTKLVVSEPKKYLPVLSFQRPLLVLSAWVGQRRSRSLPVSHMRLTYPLFNRNTHANTTTTTCEREEKGRKKGNSHSPSKYGKRPED